jgi:hypothetical protein
MTVIRQLLRPAANTGAMRWNANTVLIAPRAADRTATQASARPAMAMATAWSAAASTRIWSAVTANVMTLEPSGVVPKPHLHIYVTSMNPAAMGHAAPQTNVAIAPKSAPRIANQSAIRINHVIFSGRQSKHLALDVEIQTQKISHVILWKAASVLGRLNHITLPVRNAQVVRQIALEI